jgi:hypothetical protein
MTHLKGGGNGTELHGGSLPPSLSALSLEKATGSELMILTVSRLTRMTRPTRRMTTEKTTQKT